MVVTFEALSLVGNCVPILFRININAFSSKGKKMGKESGWLVTADSLFFYKKQTCQNAASWSDSFTIPKS